jgi:Tfp pilus assembly protein PilO
MKFWRFVLILILVSIVVVAQQLMRYLVQTDELNALKAESGQFASLIEKAMNEEERTRQQLKKAEQLHQKLRSVLPTDLQEELVEQQVAGLAGKYQIKILAAKTAIVSRSFFREATINMTLEADEAQAGQFISELKSSPRLINIVTQEQRGKKNIHLSLSVFAVTLPPAEKVELPHCIDMPTGLVLPPLQERLSLLYADYSQRCRFVTDFGEAYLMQRRLHAMQEENAQLQSLAKQLGQSR